jgi:KaiC/GvpD/RAD55 family RecA-like ATPase
LYGPPGVGKFEYCLYLIKSYLEKGESVVLITTERSPGEIKDRAKNYGLDLAQHENKSLVIIDCFSWSVGSKYEKGLNIDNPANLNEININIEKAIGMLERPVRIILDSLSPLFLHNSPGMMTKFFQVLTSKVKTEYGFILHTLQEGVHDPQIVNTLIYLVDGFLQMKFEEEDHLVRKFRVHHLKGIPSDPVWVTFRIGKKGFEVD